MNKQSDCTRHNYSNLLLLYDDYMLHVFLFNEFIACNLFVLTMWSTQPDVHKQLSFHVSVFYY